MERFDKEQDKLYRKIYGAVAWPGQLGYDLDFAIPQ